MMTFTPLRSVLAVLIMLLCAGCGSEPSTAPSSKRISSPAVGSYFVYRAVDYDHNRQENEFTIRMDTHRVLATNYEYHGRRATKISKLLDTIYYSYTEDGDIERFEEEVMGWVRVPVTTKGKHTEYFDMREINGSESWYTSEHLGQEQLMVSGEPLDVEKISFIDFYRSFRGESSSEYVFYYSRKLGVIAQTESKPWYDGSYSYHGGNSRLIRFEFK